MIQEKKKNLIHYHRDHTQQNIWDREELNCEKLYQNSIHRLVWETILLSLFSIVSLGPTGIQDYYSMLSWPTNGQTK